MGTELTARTIERFWRSTRRESECLVWTKSIRANGYGQVNVDGAVRLAHRVAYELSHGPIPDGMQIDHRCRNRACVEPAHLRLATIKQNAENREDHPATVSGIRGVRWDRARRRWSAAITHNYRTINLGRFDDLDAAEGAVVEARQRHFTHAN